jgi:hypothetical protein
MAIPDWSLVIFLFFPDRKNPGFYIFIYVFILILFEISKSGKRGLAILASSAPYRSNDLLYQVFSGFLGAFSVTGEDVNKPPAIVIDQI